MPETTLKIRVYGDSVLRKSSRLVKKIAKQHIELLSSMAQTMYAGQGIGLAAPQIGINEQLIVVDIGKELYKLINPKIIKKEGAQVNTEGCLSLPGVCIKVKRAKKVTVVAFDESGKEVEILAEGLLACVFQHEIDHLKGRMIIDYAGVLQKLKIRRKLRINT